jgi:CMP-N-acetylneuraminate monooxygenase
MTYVEPVGSLKHDQYEVERVSDDVLEIWRVSVSPPWVAHPRTRELLPSDEFTATFWSHACVEISCGETTIFTDPWLVGPAFTRGWWLAHRPSPEVLDRLAQADAVFVSHNHSDHLNLPTLRELASRNPDVPVFVPAFQADSCERLLASAGLTNVFSAPFMHWLQLSPTTRMCILPDASGRDDSGLLVDHRGHLLLNTVDCANLNGGVLPENVDLLMTSFAGGASGFPICWGELYDEDYIAKEIDSRRRYVARIAVDSARLTKPRMWMPFAGYFTEAHPADSQIRQMNRKNSPEEVATMVKRASPTTATWIPGSGETIDISDGSCEANALSPSEDTREDDFARYLPEIASAMDFAPLQSLDGIRTYFTWAGFSGDLVLHVIESDDRFSTDLRQFWVDFRQAGSVRASAPVDLKDVHYLRMRVRVDAFRYVLREQLPWEELTIGFQARFFRDPDKYNFDFWDHMQNQLPPSPIAW